MRSSRSRYSFDRLFEGNKVVLLCVLFTISIIINAITSTLRGVTVTLSIEFVVWILIYLTAPVLPLAIFQHLWEAKWIEEKDYLFWTGITLHFAVSCALILLIAFIHGFFEPLPQGAYLVSVINYAVGYAIILFGAVVVELLQTANLNKNLRKIQASHRRLDS